MKVRTGFVSNSSSSSFCVYGAYVDNDLFDQLEKNKLDILEAANIDSHGAPPYGDNKTMVGRSLTSIKDDETGKQFKDEVRKYMIEVFGESIIEKLGMHEDGWYDG
jgi:hypothetical protein